MGGEGPLPASQAEWEDRPGRWRPAVAIVDRTITPVWVAGNLAGVAMPAGVYQSLLGDPPEGSPGGPPGGAPGGPPGPPGVYIFEGI